ncbi:PepSY domain-containing protein [Tepidibacter mesophilus]|uniref:PepSY domain-containing protein n=1 Tax=Tepidibacter mesophilus TaxID=655607 RepID=UPI000C08B343|nr:PepSY domain-containing protein [Tepidibacter mesophilus]
MYFKKIIPVVLIVMLFTTGCMGHANVQKNELVTEKVNKEEGIKKVKNEEINAKITKAEARKIVLDGLEKYFNQKVDTKKFKEEIFFIEDGFLWPNNYWRVYWRNGNSKIPTYGGQIDVQTGEIVNLIDNHEAEIKKDIKKYDKVDIKEMRKIAEDFIEKNKLVKDIENIQLFEVTLDDKKNGTYIEYRYNEDHFIYISIDNSTKKVIGIDNSIIQSYGKKGENLKVNRDEAKKIALESIEKYFDKKLDSKDLIDNIQLMEQDETWWRVLFKDKKGLEEYGESHLPYVYIDPKTGEVTGAGDDESVYEDDSNEKITLEEAKQISVNYIEEKKLIKNIKSLEFLRRNKLSYNNDCELEFKYDKNKTLRITIDAKGKKVRFWAIDVK